MADNDRTQGGTGSVLGQQAQGDTGRHRDPAAPLNPTQDQTQGSMKQTQGMGQSQGQSALGGQGQDVADQGDGGQGLGATTDQLGEKKQTYGASTTHDTSGGLGPQQASFDAKGQTGNLGPSPAQSAGQDSSAATGGPNLSQGLRDQNK